MIKAGDVLVSDDALEARFACDLGCCRGACCRVGDIGAPLADGEREAVLLALPALVESAPATSGSRIRSGDVFDRFFEKTLLACHPEGPCVLSFPGPDGILGCQLERAWRAGRTRFPKPRFCQGVGTMNGQFREAGGWFVDDGTHLEGSSALRGMS